MEQNFEVHALGYRAWISRCLCRISRIALFRPDCARQRLLEALSHQKQSGYAPRQYPIAPWGDYDWRDYRDSPFWVVFGLEKLLKETGDIGLLHEHVGFVDSDDSDTVFGHAVRAVDYLWRERGSHGLCLLGQGDWLDSLNDAGVKGKGESIWLSMAYCYAMYEMADLATMMEREDLSEFYRVRALEMAAAINAGGWDGEWYLAAINDAGEKIGSHVCADGGKIFLIPQAWAVLAGIADLDRAQMIMSACDEHLSTDTGYLCFSPMFKEYRPGVGRISLWPSEGGSVYSHAALFKVVADCMMGEGDRAWRTLQRLVPASGLLSAEETGAEPFTVPNAYMGPEWPKPNWTYQGWWTATVDWIQMALIEHIFAPRPIIRGCVLIRACPAIGPKLISSVVSEETSTTSV